jgi:hypothetical protein
MGERRRKGLVLACVVLVLSTGCSWVLVQPVSARLAPDEPVECTTGRGPPIADSLFALVALASSIYLARDHAFGDHLFLGFMGGATVTAVFGSSAGYGFSRTSRCHDARRAAQLRDERELRNIIGTSPNDASPSSR